MVRIYFKKENDPTGYYAGNDGMWPSDDAPKCPDELLAKFSEKLNSLKAMAQEGESPLLEQTYSPTGELMSENVMSNAYPLGAKYRDKD